MAPVMSANENVYEDIGPDSQIVRNLIRTESQVRTLSFTRETKGFLAISCFLEELKSNT